MKKSSSPEPSSPSWDAVLLVCKACRGRSQAPKGMKNKAVMQEAKRALRDARPRPRSVLSSCLGLCPKGATAVAFAGDGRATRIVAVRSLAETSAAVASLVAPTP
jgi:predicted metal-binding protein